MGWGNCGLDSNGRPIGYHFEATCDHPGCTKEIDRGLSYACGGMHGEDVYSCERYFCENHRSYIDVPDNNGHAMSLCSGCAARIEWDPESEDELPKLTEVHLHWAHSLSESDSWSDDESAKAQVLLGMFLEERVELLEKVEKLTRQSDAVGAVNGDHG